MKIPQWLVRRRHYGDSVLIGMYAVLTLVDLLLPEKGIIREISTDLIVPTFVLSMTLTGSHERGELCEKCIKILPLNIERRVDRRRPWLKTHHLFSNIPGMLAYAAILIGLVVVSAFVHGWWYRAANVGLDLAICWRLSSALVHRHLFPWCPWCRDDDGYDDESAEAPDPVIPQTA